MDSMHNFKVFSQVWLDLVVPIGSNCGFNSFTSPSLPFPLLPALFCFFDLVARSVADSSKVRTPLSQSIIEGLYLAFAFTTTSGENRGSFTIGLSEDN